MSVTCARAALGRNFSWKCLKAMGMFVYGFGKQRPAVYEKAQVDGDTTEEPSSSRLGWEFTIYAHAGVGDTGLPVPGFGASVGGYYKVQKELEWSPQKKTLFSRMYKFFSKLGSKKKSGDVPKDVSDARKGLSSGVRKSIISEADLDDEADEEDTTSDTTGTATLAGAVAAEGAVSSDTTTTG